MTTTTLRAAGQSGPRYPYYPSPVPFAGLLAWWSELGNRSLLRTLGLAARVRTLDVRVKVADSEDELRQIHELNRQIYVDELGQDRPPAGHGGLVDKFHETNVYLVAKRGDEVIGMAFITLPQHRFSIEDSLADTSALEGIRHQTVELRRLAVKPEHRHGRIMLRIFEFGFHYCQERGVRYAVLSGLQQQRRLYKKLGAWDIGEPFTKGACTYYPMMMSAEIIRSPRVDKSELRIRRRGCEGTRRCPAGPG